MGRRHRPFRAFDDFLLPPTCSDRRRDSGAGLAVADRSRIGATRKTKLLESAFARSTRSRLPASCPATLTTEGLSSAHPQNETQKPTP